MTSLWRHEERFMRRLVGRGSRRGASRASRAGDVLRQPIVWAGFPAAVCVTAAARKLRPPG